jgi:hypothetical protein
LGVTTDLELWTVYDHPSDFPDHWVARRSVVGRGGATVTGAVIRAETLEGLRLLLPPGMACLTRQPDDDPTIVEVWL